ncbi:MAG: alpha/beta hydrolase [Anaerolineaceae bacterium]|nr:alpha/beta hydrolase [Anaerolineaceae bacterium]
MEQDTEQTDHLIKKKEKRWKTVLGWILRNVLPFVMIAALVALVYYVWQDYQEKTDPEVRQQALEDNMINFLERDLGYTISDDVEDFELTLCPFYINDAWDNSQSPEEAGLICGNVTVPLYHEDPEKGSMKIPIAIWPDYNPEDAIDPLFVSQGGPGGSTLDIFPDRFYSNSLGGKRDVVFIDQRGTRYTEPSLVCPEEMEYLLASSPEERQDYYVYFQALQSCRERLADEGVDLSAFTTAQIAGDFEAVRQALGYEKYNFYGVSYGAHIGQYLAAYYPDHLRSVVLDGVTPIPFNYTNRVFSTYNRVLVEIFTSCNEDVVCSEKYPDIILRFNNLLDRLEEEPVLVKLHDPNSKDTISEEIDGEEFYAFVFQSAYMDDYYTALPYVIEQAEQNNFEPYIFISEMMTFEDENSTGLYFSVVCSEHVPFKFQIPEGTVSIPSAVEWEEQDLEAMQKACEIWGVDPSPQTLEKMPISNVPALLMSGNFDPITPPIYAEKALDSFSQGQHIIDPIGSHGVAFSDSCTEQIFHDFLDDPAADLDISCLEKENRRISTILPTSVSSPFLKRLIRSEFVLVSQMAVPVLMLVIMLIRGALQYTRLLWRKVRGNVPEPTSSEALLRLRFELATWAFLVGSLAITAGFGYFLTSSHDAMFNAMALPGGVRFLYVIPLLLVLTLPAIIYSAVLLWKYSRSVFGRFYLLVQTVVCTVTVIQFGYIGLLTALF